MENTIKQLLNEIQTISESYKRVAEATGENFNIFSVLQMERNEVKTHSRFIAELLNPKGSHGQKDLFLKKFVELIQIEGFDTTSAVVKVEFSIGKKTEDSGGRLDIKIKDSKNKIILIENKIDAPEQEKQLIRYKNYVSDDTDTLLFLTLEGQESKDINIPLEKYRCISYKSDILNWLEECRKEATNIPILRESITQYMNLIKKLTGQNVNTKMSEEITEKIITDKEKFETFITLFAAGDDIKKRMIQQIVEHTLPNLIIKTGKDLQLETDYKELNMLNHSVQRRSFWFTNAALEKLNLSICFSFNVESGFQRLIFGFRYVDYKQNENPKYEIIRKEFEKKFQKKLTSFDWLCWRDFDEYYDWRDFKVLKNIQFGNFKSDFEEKVAAMLNIINP
ncbi:PD-(D/E)XK nuclease family protein [Emticicia sp.]|uniref:PDDEXK-like family protein n=1 Tax=Emticicia sp. TaxID=1930953 RepID=UPI0037537725